MVFQVHSSKYYSDKVLTRRLNISKNLGFGETNKIQYPSIRQSETLKKIWVSIVLAERI